jgi:hypothetical protein
MTQIVPGQNVQTQVKVLKVNTGRYGMSLDLDIPLMGKKEFKFVDWRQKGPTPEVGAMLLATLRHKRRSSYWMKEGAFIDNESSEVTGEEKPWHLDWECLEVEPLTASTPTADSPPQTSAPAKNGASVYMDGNLRYRIDQEAINDREAIRMVLTHGAAEGGNIYKDMEVVLVEAEPVASWLNNRLAVRLGGGMVAYAQQLGAVVTKVEKAEKNTETATPTLELQDEIDSRPQVATQEALLQMEDDALAAHHAIAIQGLKNRADLQGWAGEMGWSRDEILIPLKRAGYEDSKAYLAKKGNTVQSLADFLLTALSAPEGDGSW